MKTFLEKNHDLIFAIFILAAIPICLMLSSRLANLDRHTEIVSVVVSEPYYKDLTVPQRLTNLCGTKDSPRRWQVQVDTKNDPVYLVSRRDHIIVSPVKIRLKEGDIVVFYPKKGKKITIYHDEWWKQLFPKEAQVDIKKVW